jgi:hypothetical protein
MENHRPSRLSMSNCVKTHNTYNGRESIGGMDSCLILWVAVVLVEEELFPSFSCRSRYSSTRSKIKPDKSIKCRYGTYSTIYIFFYFVVYIILLVSVLSTDITLQLGIVNLFLS